MDNNEGKDIIVDMFEFACEFIVEEGHEECEYRFAENTIYATLTYFKEKRGHEEK